MGILSKALNDLSRNHTPRKGGPAEGGPGVISEVTAVLPQFRACHPRLPPLLPLPDDSLSGPV